MTTIERIAIVGTGVMGTGIARMCLEAGLSVALADRSPAALDASMRELAGLDPAYPEGIEHGPLSLTLRKAGVVIDATPQLVGEKAALLREIGERTPPTTLIGTVTLATPLRVLDPDRVLLARLVGLHFMNPPHRLRLCELVVREGVEPASVERAAALLAGLSVDGMKVADTPAFVLNRVLVPFLLDAVRTVERGQADAAAVDLAFTRGCGHPMGPLAVLDLLGLGVALRTAEQLHAAYPDDPRFEPPTLLRRMAEHGERFHRTAGGSTSR